jgi:CheY-like chemotaxis protein
MKDGQPFDGWYYKNSEVPRGPVTRAELRRLVGDGVLRLDDTIYERVLPGGQPAGMLAVRDVVQRPRQLVLVVDDHFDCADTLGWLVRLWGADTLTAYLCDDALRLARVHEPDVALLDISMPKMDGYELARRIRAQSGEPPVLIAVTGYGAEDDVRQARDAGFVHHFLKPVDPGALRETLARLWAAKVTTDGHGAASAPA